MVLALLFLSLQQSPSELCFILNINIILMKGWQKIIRPSKKPPLTRNFNKMCFRVTTTCKPSKQLIHFKRAWELRKSHVIRTLYTLHTIRLIAIFSQWIFLTTEFILVAFSSLFWTSAEVKERGSLLRTPLHRFRAHCAKLFLSHVLMSPL